MLTMDTVVFHVVTAVESADNALILKASRLCKPEQEKIKINISCPEKGQKPGEAARAGSGLVDSCSADESCLLQAKVLAALARVRRHLKQQG